MTDAVLLTPPQTPAAPAVLLSAAGVYKSFRTGETWLEVLRDADFELRAGEFVAIEGRSGSGKSTLLHVLAGLDSYDQGTLRFDAQPYGRQTPSPPSRWRMALVGGHGEGTTSWWVRFGLYAVIAGAGFFALTRGWNAVMYVANGWVGKPWSPPAPDEQWWARVSAGLLALVIVLLGLRWALDVASFFARLLSEPTARLRNKQFGFVFQSYHLLPELNVLENTLLAPEIEFSSFSSRANWRIIRQRGIDLLTQLGMAHRLKHRVAQLSGGERQRVAIARALMNQPRVLFADEPTGNLDVETGRQIMDVLEGLHRDRGQTIVMVTHDRSLAREADRVLVLRGGKLELVEVGATSI